MTFKTLPLSFHFKRTEFAWSGTKQNKQPFPLIKSSFSWNSLKEFLEFFWVLTCNILQLGVAYIHMYVRRQADTPKEKHNFFRHREWDRIRHIKGREVHAKKASKWQDTMYFWWVEVEVMGLLDRGGDTAAVQSMGTVIYAMSIKLAQTSSISAGTLRLALSFAGWTTSRCREIPNSFRVFTSRNILCVSQCTQPVNKIN